MHYPGYRTGSRDTPRDLALVSDPEFTAGYPYGGVTVEGGLTLHALGPYCSTGEATVHWVAECTATQCGIQCGIRDIARDPWIHGQLKTSYGSALTRGAFEMGH